MEGLRRGGQKAEGCCIKRAIESDYIHNQDGKQVKKSHVRDTVQMYLVNWSAMLTVSRAEDLKQMPWDSA
jgi:hypothetical protein